MVTETATGKKVSPITERPRHLLGKWAIGCAICANVLANGLTDTKACSWNKFAVTGSGVYLNGIRKHLLTDAHQEAVTISAHQTWTQAASQSQPKQLDGVMGGALGGQVPRADKFILAVTSCRRAESARAFAPKADMNNMTSPLMTVGVNRDTSAHSYRKMIEVADAVLTAAHQDILRKAVRISFSEDDRDIVRALRVRVVWDTPTVGAKEFFGGIVQEAAFDAREKKATTLKALRNMCIIRRGRRNTNKSKQAVIPAESATAVSQDRPGVQSQQPPVQSPQPPSQQAVSPDEEPPLPPSQQAVSSDEELSVPPVQQAVSPDAEPPADCHSVGMGPDDYFDHDLWAKVVDAVFCGASDGAPVALQAVQLLRKDGDLPKLRYQFRDQPHTTRTCIKVTFKTSPQGKNAWNADN